MTAGEDEFQALVGKCRGGHRYLDTIACDDQTEFGGEDPVAADAVRGSVPSRPHQPGTRLARNAVAWPPLGGDGERLLRGVLREFEVAEQSDQGGQDAAPFLAEDLIEWHYQ